MRLINKLNQVTLWQPVKRPKLFVWILVIVSVFALLGAFVFKNLIGWLIAGIVVAVCLVLKLLFYNHLDYINNEECIQWFGKPGSGKSFFMAREADHIKKRTGRKIIVNKAFSHYASADAVCSRSDLGHKDLCDGTLMLWDEGNLDGFDNRRSAENFKDNATLDFFLKHRHNGNPMMFTSQGYDSLDKKIRENVCTGWYFCRKYGPFVVAQRLYTDLQLDPKSSKPEDLYIAAAPIEALTQKDAWLFGIPALQNKGLYKTCCRSNFDKGAFFED